MPFMPKVKRYEVKLGGGVNHEFENGNMRTM
jgi:hypothetical protein